MNEAAKDKSSLRKYEVTFRDKNEFEFTNKWTATYMAEDFGHVEEQAKQDEGDDEIWRIELYD